MTAPTLPMNLIPAPNLIAALPEFPTLRESLAFQTIGLIVVFIALCSIWVLLEIIGLYFRRNGNQTAATPTPAKAPSDGTADPATIILVAAAVHASLGAGHRVHAITPAASSADESGKR